MSETPQTVPPPRAEWFWRVRTPGSLLVQGVLCVLVTWWALAWFGSACTVSARRWQGKPPFEAFAQMQSIRSRLTPRAAEAMGALFVEGRLFTYSFYGFSLINMASADPENAAFRSEVLAELEQLIGEAVRLGTERPFNTARATKPPGGVIAAGHRNLLRAGYALLGGKREDIIRSFHEESAIFNDAFLSSTLPVLESYPHLRWPVDNCCALESLRIHDVVYGTDYSAARKRWSDWIVAHLDPATGMIPSEIDMDGTMIDQPRGCALSWSLAFLPAIAPELAAQQYERYRSQWFLHPFGTTGAREWPPGRDGCGDSDSGPVVMGIGCAASGFGIAAAKANRDWANLTGMLRGLELTGFPAWTFLGEKRYFGETVILAEILALWGKTQHPWDKPPEEAGTSPSPWPAPPNGRYWIPLLVYGIVLCGIAFRECYCLSRACRRALKAPRRSLWSKVNRCFFGTECAVIAAWLIVPAFSWIWAMPVLVFLDIADRMLGRSK